MESYSKRVGNLGEVAVCHYVSQMGYEVVCRNYTVHGGEIDVVACDDEYVLFIEVKTRRYDCLSSGLQAITRAKMRCIAKAASRFCSDRKVRLQPRFDVAEVTVDEYQNVLDVQYYPDAFDTTDLGVYIPIY
jgi:putative endonuclease